MHTNNNACKRCGKPAYAAESYDIDANRFHRTCFKCAECKITLAPASFTTVDGELFCKRHATHRTVHVKPHLASDALGVSTTRRKPSAVTGARAGEATCAGEVVKGALAGSRAGEATRAAGEVVKGALAGSRVTPNETAGRMNAVAMLTRSACEACGKSAFPIESVDIDGKKWHKSCFKCVECSVALTLSSFVKADGKLYCRRDVPKDAPGALRSSSSAKKASASTPDSTVETTTVETTTPSPVKEDVSENNAVEVEEAVKENVSENAAEVEEAVASDEATLVDKETALTATAPEECEVIDVVAPTEDDEKQPKDEAVAMATAEPHVDETSETQENETPKGNVIEKQVEEITKDVAAVNVSDIPAPKTAPLNGGGGSGGAGGKKKKKRGGGKK